MSNVHEHIANATDRYARLPLFEAFRADRIPVERFPAFFCEQAMAARWFQDFIWATTEIHEGPLAAFAARHRRRDSGHYRWTEQDLARSGLPPMTVDDHFALEMLPTRVQLARILATLHDADDAARVVVLACLEAAGTVTLGTLHGYAARHGLGKALRYLGEGHVRVEETQVDEIARHCAPVLAFGEPRLLSLVDTVFDALTRMFDDGGRRYYGDLLEVRHEA